MKIKALFFLVFLNFSLLFGNTHEERALPIGDVRQVVLNYTNDQWMICLDDTSCWEIPKLKRNRKKTWHEWWHKIDPEEWTLSDSYFFDPSQWGNHPTVQVYELEEPKLEGYLHLIVNVETDQKVFANYIPLGTKRIPKREFARKFFDYPLAIHRLDRNLYFVNHMIVLEDQSIWKIVQISKIWRTFADWWNGVEYDQPDPEFLFSLYSWKNSDKIKIYCYTGMENSHLDIYDRNNHQREMFLLENLSTNSLAFATKESLKSYTDYFLEYSRREYWRGYSDGYSAGSSSCSCNKLDGIQDLIEEDVLEEVAEGF